MQKLDPSKKEAILEAARLRFYRYGIQKTSLKDIASDVGLAVGTLYLYFKNKDDLLNACTDAFEQRHQEVIDATLSSSSTSVDKLRQYVFNRFITAKNTRENSDHAAEIARAVIRVNPGRLASESRMMLETVTAILRQGCQDGEFKIADVAHDVEVFLYAIAFFFPIAGKEPMIELTQEKLTKIIDWFIAQWRQN